MGYKGGLVVSLTHMLKPALGNLAYSMILADTFRSLFKMAGIIITRDICLLMVTLVGILPLCLMNNLDALAPLVFWERRVSF
jgi:amino acid permease